MSSVVRCQDRVWINADLQSQQPQLEYHGVQR
ncbi:unnamed protein product, partial [Didymodactylos carnosus]